MDTHDSSEDIRLWSLIQAGDRKSLETIYRKYYPLLYNYGIKICSDKEMVKDCIHDVYVKIFSSPSLGEINNVRYYLLRALRNTLINKIEREKKTTSENIDESHFNFIMTESFLQKAYPYDDQETESIQKIKTAYNTLSSKQKHILYLRYILDLNYNEISDILNVGSQSAMNLLSRTLHKMRNFLSNK